MTGVSFNQISPNWKVPLISIEVDNSQANSATGNKPALLCDYAFGGTAEFNKPIPVGSPSQAAELFGLGSPLERAFSVFYLNNKSQIVYCMAIKPSETGSEAKGTITISGTATISGTYSCYIAGQLVNVGVNDGDDASIVASNISSAVNAYSTLPVTAKVNGSVVTLTARWKGITGNDITIIENYRGTSGGEQLPAGLIFTYSGKTLADGAGVPKWNEAIASLGDENYKFVSLAHTDSGSLLAWNTEYGFSDSGRWGWIRMLYGQIWSAARGSYSSLIGFGSSLNYPTTSILSVEAQSPSPVWEWAAAYTARASAAFTIDPARPLQTLTLLGVLPAPKENRFSKTERNGLASNGLATQTVYSNDIAQIDREQTTYQFNNYARPDNSYEVATTLATLDEVLTRMANSITSKYPRHKLVDNGTAVAPGQAVISPKMAKAELITEYRRLEYNGLVENTLEFKANLVAQRSATNPNRLEVLFPPNLIGGLRNLDVLAQFRLDASVSATSDYI